MENRPPIHTLTMELIDWSIGRIADFPRNERFTVGQRIENIELDVVERITRARFTTDKLERIDHLDELNIQLELLRVLWRIAQTKNWISVKQCLHVNKLIDEIGRMNGAWIKATKNR